MNSPTMFRTTGTLTLAALSLFLLCGQTAPVACKDQPAPSHTGAEVAGVAVAAGVVIGTVVLVHVHNSHHNIKGCVVSGPGGLEVRSGSGTDAKSYKLTGDTNVKVGDQVKLHGSKIKKDKNSTEDQTFTVEKLTKDYGACKVTP
jgi:hypothetical protein